MEYDKHGDDIKASHALKYNCLKRSHFHTSSDDELQPPAKKKRHSGLHQLHLDYTNNCGNNIMITQNAMPSDLHYKNMSYGSEIADLDGYITLDMTGQPEYSINGSRDQSLSIVTLDSSCTESQVIPATCFPYHKYECANPDSNFTTKMINPCQVTNKQIHAGINYGNDLNSFQLDVVDFDYKGDQNFVNFHFSLDDDTSVPPLGKKKIDPSKETISVLPAELEHQTILGDGCRCQDFGIKPCVKGSELSVAVQSAAEFYSLTCKTEIAVSIYQSVLEKAFELIETEGEVLVVSSSSSSVLGSSLSTRSIPEASICILPEKVLCEKEKNEHFDVGSLEAKETKSASDEFVNVVDSDTTSIVPCVETATKQARKRIVYDCGPSKQNQTKTGPEPDRQTETKRTLRVIKPEFEFISTDPNENADNFNPRWEALRKIHSDEERYRVIRKRWRNLSIPDANKDLTCRQYRFGAPPPQLAVPGPSVTVAHPKKHQRSHSCTALYERIISNMGANYNQQFKQISHQQRMEIFQLCNKQDMEQKQVYATIWNPFLRNQALQTTFCEQQKEMINLQEFHERSTKLFEERRQEDMRLYQACIEEVRSFNSFYNGLEGREANESPDDHLLLTDEQYQHLEETERMYSEFQRLYKSN